MSTPVTVAIGSLFRNSAKTLGYFRALFENQLGDGTDFQLRFSLIEGDSADDTYERLERWRDEDPRVLLGKLDVEPILDFEDRVQKWAELGNAVIDALDGHSYDYFLWCESDLCVPPDLVRQLVKADKDIVAPGIFLGGMFYDTWGFRALDGSHYGNTTPFHPSYQPFALQPLGSVGSVVLFRRAVIDSGLRFRGVHDDGLLVGLCQDARSLGFQVWHDSRVSVIHPTSLWKAQQYSLGRIDVEIPDGDPREVAWRSAVRALLETEHPVIATPDLPADHPALSGVRAIVEKAIPGQRFTLRTKLLSEAPKRYALVITELDSAFMSCLSSNTQ